MSEEKSGLQTLTYKFDFGIKVTLGLKSTCLDGYLAEIGFNVLMTNRVKV